MLELVAKLWWVDLYPSQDIYSVGCCWVMKLGWQVRRSLGGRWDKAPVGALNWLCLNGLTRIRNMHNDHQVKQVCD